MALGAYSVVRYSDSLRDERINLGVVVWHPSEGFQWRVLPASELDRVHAVNPIIRGKDLKRQIGVAEKYLSEKLTQGKESLTELSQWLRDGLQVSAPYPARLYSATETADRLFSMLVRRAEVQTSVDRKTFEGRVVASMRDMVVSIDPSALVEEIGDRYLLGYRVNVGVRARIQNHDSLWRMITLRSKYLSTVVDRAKVAASDIRKLKLVDEYRDAKQIVAAHTFVNGHERDVAEAEKWIEGEGATLIKIPRWDDISTKVSEGLMLVA